jgi:hypothetical protein
VLFFHILWTGMEIVETGYKPSVAPELLNRTRTITLHSFLSWRYALQPDSTRFIHVLGVKRSVYRYDCKCELETRFFLELQRCRCWQDAHWRDQVEKDVPKRVDIMFVVSRFAVHVLSYCLVISFTVVCDTSKVGAGFVIFCGLVVKYFICYKISDMKLQWR